jgi:16S rRNA (cytosine967-C5)-methyltransferase
VSYTPRRPRRPAKPHRRPRKDPVRILAFEALRAVDERDAYANLVLPSLLRKAREKEGPERFDGRDAALATELVYGTLRRRGTYDAILAACVDRPLKDVDPPVLDVLSLGVHQLLGTRIPSHAAVSATVELARVVLGDGRARFVNAVLRRVARDDLDGWLEKVAPPYDEDPEEHLAVVHSHPRWVVSALWDSLGGGRTDIEELLRADNERPEVTLVARPGRAGTEELLREESAVPGRWSPYAVRLAEGGEPGAVAAVREGRAGVQDEGSQLVALALANAPLDGPDEKWLDGCAGPGGKAALLAALAAERGAVLVAAEKQHHRAGLVARALAGNPGPYQVITADGTRPAWRPGSFDRVLVDVPCTGLGALRRRPEARWRAVPRTWRSSPRSSAVCCARPSSPCGSAGSSATPPARPIRPRPARSSPTCSSSSPGPSRSTPVLFSRVLRASRTSATAPTSSCGRTGTGPTRCTWPSSAAPAEDRTG